MSGRCVATFGRVVLRDPFVITCICRPSLFAWSVLRGSWEVCRCTVFLAHAVAELCAALISFRGSVVVEKYNAWAGAVTSLKSVRWITSS